jgi:hypothetical protein
MSSQLSHLVLLAAATMENFCTCMHIHCIHCIHYMHNGIFFNYLSVVFFRSDFRATMLFSWSFHFQENSRSCLKVFLTFLVIQRYCISHNLMDCRTWKNIVPSNGKLIELKDTSLVRVQNADPLHIAFLGWPHWQEHIWLYISWRQNNLNEAAFQTW